MPRKSKTFQEGMAAGAAPFEEKFNKQAEAVEKVGKSINAKLDGISGIMDVVLDEMSVQERKRIYDLNTVVDISKMDKTEKEFLCAVIFAVANQNECLTDGQKKYLLSLKKHLMVVDIQQGIDLSAIENIENTSTQKAILQVLMEFLFIEYQCHDYMDDYEDIFDYFSVSRKGVREIQEAVDNLYETFGIDGIINHYAFFDETPKQEQPASISAAFSSDGLLASAEKAFIANNMQEAFATLTFLVSQNNPRAFYLMTIIYQDGYGVVNIEKKKAEELCRKGAELGDSLCKKTLVDFASDKKEKNEIYTSVFDEVYELAMKGDVSAIYELGNIFNNADEPLGDTEKAEYWFTEGAKLGYGRCWNRLGLLYDNRKGYDEAFKMFQKGADCGYIYSINNLANCYLWGQGCKVDLKKALELYLEAAEKGCVASQLMLGKIYDDRYIYPKKFGHAADAETAKKWYRKAADNESGKAYFHLAEKTDPDHLTMKRETYNLLLKAIEHGYKDAEKTIARYICSNHVDFELMEELCAKYGKYKIKIFGDRCPAAYNLAKEHFDHLKELADNGDSIAQIFYGALRLDPVYCKEFYSPATAEKYLNMARENGALDPNDTFIGRIISPFGYLD